MSRAGHGSHHLELDVKYKYDRWYQIISVWSELRGEKMVSSQPMASFLGWGHCKKEPRSECLSPPPPQLRLLQTLWLFTWPCSKITPLEERTLFLSPHFIFPLWNTLSQEVTLLGFCGWLQTVRRGRGTVMPGRPVVLTKRIRKSRQFLLPPYTAKLSAVFAIYGSLNTLIITVLTDALGYLRPVNRSGVLRKHTAKGPLWVLMHCCSLLNICSLQTTDMAIFLVAFSRERQQ